MYNEKTHTKKTPLAVRTERLVIMCPQQMKALETSIYNSNVTSYKVRSSRIYNCETIERTLARKFAMKKETNRKTNNLESSISKHKPFQQQKSKVLEFCTLKEINRKLSR